MDAVRPWILALAPRTPDAARVAWRRSVIRCRTASLSSSRPRRKALHSPVIPNSARYERQARSLPYHEGVLDDISALRTNLSGRSGGKGPSEAASMVSAIGEALERCSGVFRGEEEICLRASYAERGNRAVHPNDCLLFSAKQYEERKTWNASQGTSGFHAVPNPPCDDIPINWTPVWSLTGGALRYVPSSYCYYSHPDLVRFGPVERPAWRREAPESRRPRSADRSAVVSDRDITGPPIRRVPGFDKVPGVQISTSRPTSTTWGVGTPKYAAGRLALRCIAANSRSRHTAIPNTLPLGTTKILRE
jgi:YcaO cyclodehydratase, ATP-ad Mg2+-binding